MLLDLSRHRVGVGKLGALRMPPVVDGAIELSPVHSLRRRSQECGFEECHLNLRMTGLTEEVACRNRVAAGQPVHPVLVPFPWSSGFHLVAPLGTDPRDLSFFLNGLEANTLHAQL